MAKRYAQMIPLIAAIQPRTIAEVGVHRAKRAVMLCREALKYGPVHYIGYDVFETKDAAFQADALNGKGTPLEAHARAHLDALAAEFPDFSYELIVGDTRDTLQKHPLIVDFAFIDGDHRVEVIEGDYLALCGSRLVVLDDYYLASPACALDLSKYGANTLVGELIGNWHETEILPVGDVCNHGGIAHLVAVSKVAA